MIEDIRGKDLDVQEGNFLRINLVGAGNVNTADDPVEGLLGYPEGRNFKFSNIRLKGGTLAEVTQVSAEKPLNGLTLENITGTCVKGISIQHISHVVLRDIKVTGIAGPLVLTNGVDGTGLDGAVPYNPPRR
jgi:hypothetical protein